MTLDNFGVKNVKGLIRTMIYAQYMFINHVLIKSGVKRPKNAENN